MTSSGIRVSPEQRQVDPNEPMKILLGFQSYHGNKVTIGRDKNKSQPEVESYLYFR